MSFQYHFQFLQVNERPVPVDEILAADEVFCTGTAVVVNPVGSITHGTSRVQCNDGAVGEVSLELYEALTSLQMGVSKDEYDWTVEVA
ncbi:branched-chain amino acid aminotransferase 2, chloroplastic [Physcomitrium patens]|uniref:branched-chain amino acid aminotransferase 2, chloroplastic n=1 Tax=Physcomitrium patens TaxID=3218 RepID=UPI000D163935|nr:branched-chain amino acid aminotransferase 2, chloroplastic-like [Physcomitrium patens]|eukprot:XP_024366254.1 branched-chain amino acid aminotransferase 2, chloroplastic-like [Physcomitrella patens]